ncbi:Gfo/Idh/MocA family oxidoreductase [Candidatus Puniceispirillum sp.]|nr:Gfo/Idh/MocA family oxidoreductase [Candidatus Puniceispirillum sp.]
MQRILIVGYGSIGQRHLRIVRESLPDATIMVVRHQPSIDVPEMANLVTSSIDEVRSFEPEAAIIANPAPFHLHISKTLAETGCHLLIEKPISDRLDGVESLLETVRAAGVICQVGYNMRYLPALSWFRDLINQGLVGRPLSVRCEIGQYLPTWRPGTDYQTGVSARSELGGGVLLELSHEIDYLNWIFGEVDWVSSWVGYVGNLNIDVEDTAHLILGFKSNGPGKQIIASLNLDFIRHDTTRICTVIGSDGSLRWNALTGVIDIYKPGGNGWDEYGVIPHHRDDSYRAQWKDFLNSVAQRKEPLVSGKTGLSVLEIVEAAKASAQNKSARERLPVNHAVHV